MLLRGSAKPFTCICAAESEQEGSAWGTDIYSDDSFLCRAARHAGAVGRLGGPVTLIPMAGQQLYIGTLRNGIRTADRRSTGGSFRFERSSTPEETTATLPVQAPIADTLRRTGQVQLYIRFRTNSWELDESATPTLLDLRNALMDNPGMRLRLIGYTDSTGTLAGNQVLSARRADAVSTWLVAHGIPSSRLAAEGRGQSDPVADNDTDTGRALNRRVQAKRLDAVSLTR